MRSDRIAPAVVSGTVVVQYGCYECLLPHEGPLGITECPHCAGLTGTMPAAEQPTLEARRAVAWEERRS